MSTIAIISFFLILAFISLFVVSAVNKHQMRQRLINQRLAQMKRHANELEELSISLESLTGSAPIAQTITDEALDTVEKMIKLSPNSQHLQLFRDNLQRRSEELLAPDRQLEVYRLMESDAAIARSLYTLNEAGRIIRKRQTSDKIELAQMENFIQELSWSHLMVNIVSHIAQGHKAMQRGDVLKAHAFYRKAQQLATETPHPDERRQQIIRELGDILSNRRRTLSTELMPETTYVPDDDMMLPTQSDDDISPMSDNNIGLDNKDADK